MFLSKKDWNIICLAGSDPNGTRDYRGISEGKLVFNPYYPVNNARAGFQGFPADIEGKVIGFGGGQFYKFLIDNNLVYLNIIKKLLLEHDNLIFFLNQTTFEGLSFFHREER